MVNLKKTSHQIIVAVGTALTLIASLWIILTADDRWNQAHAVAEVNEKIAEVEESTVNLARELSNEVLLKFEEQRLERLKDKLLDLKLERKNNPDDQDIKDWIEDTRADIQRSKETKVLTHRQ